MAWKCDRDRRVHKRPHKNDHQIFCHNHHPLVNATVTVTFPSHKKHCKYN
jgi:hypothetical protein